MVRHVELVQRKAPGNTTLFFSSKGTQSCHVLRAIIHTFAWTGECGKKEEHLINSPHTGVKEEKRSQHGC